MAGITFDADFSAAARALARLNAEQLAMVADKIANLVEEQTKLRISDEKTSPDGVRWVPWTGRTRGWAPAWGAVAVGVQALLRHGGCTLQRLQAAIVFIVIPCEVQSAPLALCQRLLMDSTVEDVHWVGRTTASIVVGRYYLKGCRNLRQAVRLPDGVTVEEG